MERPSPHMQQKQVQDQRYISPLRQDKQMPSAQSSNIGKPKEMFAFKKDMIEKVNKVRNARNLTPSAFRARFNPRDHTTPTKKLTDIDKLLAEKDLQYMVSYREPLPRFRSAKNSPLKDYEHKALMVRALKIKNEAEEMKIKEAEEMRKQSLKARRLEQLGESITNVRQVHVPHVPDTEMKEPSEEEYADQTHAQMVPSVEEQETPLFNEDAQHV